MKNVLTAYHKIKPPHLLIGIFSVLVISIATTFAVTAIPRQPIAGIATTTTLNAIKTTPTITPTVTITPTTVVNGLTLPAGRQEPFPTITTVPKISAKPTSAATPTQIPSPTPIQAAATTNSPTTTPTQTPTPTQTTSTVSLQIQTPDGTNNATVTLTNGANVCDVLQEAKNEGKIASVTFDDSYMASLHSKYVVEINGYSNNWTFTVNGSSPLGCSLSNPKPNDSIVWRFG